MTEINYVSYEAKYFSAIYELEQDLFPADAWSKDTFAAEFELIGQTREYWVALDGDKVVGYCGIYFLPPDADIQTIAVCRSHWRRGIGAKLLELMLNRAVELGSKNMMLEVRPDNLAAISLYQSAGFAAIGERANYYGPGISALVMRNPDLLRGRSV